MSQLTGKLLGYFLLSLLSLALNGQSTSTIKVVDAIEQTPLLGAHISLSDLSKKQTEHFTTNMQGTISATISSPQIADIRFVGYETIIDTLQVGEQKTIELKPKAYELSTAVVTAQYGAEELRNAVHNVELISLKEIKASGADNLGELLQQQLNIDIAYDNVLGSNINMQGIGGENVKILIDGIPVIGRLNGNVDLSQINLSNAERVEIAQGPLSTIYGTDAMGGVINLITKKTQLNRFEGNINTYFESVGVYNFDGRFGFQKDDYGIQINAGRKFFDGYDPTESSIDRIRSLQWKPKEQYFATYNYRRSFKNAYFNHRFNYFQEKLTNRGQPNYYAKALDQYYTTERLDNAFFIEGNKNNNFLYDINLSFNQYKRIKNSFIKDMTNLEEQLSLNEADHDTTIFVSWLSRASFSLNQQSKTIKYQLGYEVNFEQGNGDRIDSTRTLGDVAIYGGFNYQPIADLSIQPNVRIAYNTQYSVPLIPSLNIRYNIGQWTWRASYAKGFRAPSLKELYMEFVDTNHNIHGNENLEAERSDNFFLSLNYFKRYQSDLSVALSTELSYNLRNNLISLANISSQTNYFTYINIDHSKMLNQSAKMNVQYRNFEVKVGASFRLMNDIGQRSLNTDLFSCQFSSGIAYENPDWNAGGQINLKHNFTQYRYLTASTGEIDIQEILPYSLLDASIYKKFWNNKLECALGVKNLTNVSNIDLLGESAGVHSNGAMAIGWGRSFFTSLKLSLF